MSDRQLLRDAVAELIALIPNEVTPQVRIQYDAHDSRIKFGKRTTSYVEAVIDVGRSESQMAHKVFVAWLEYRHTKPERDGQFEFILGKSNGGPLPDKFLHALKRQCTDETAPPNDLVVLANTAPKPNIDGDYVALIDNRK